MITYFLKRLLLFNALLSPPSFLVYRYFVEKNFNPSRDQILELYKDQLSQNISLTEDSDPNIRIAKNKFLYSLFSSNLTDFSKNLHEYFYKWFLFKWGDELLEEKSDAFLDSKIKIFNELKKNMNSYTYDPSKLSPENWRRENYIIEKSNETLKKEFEAIFFKKIYLNGNGGGSRNIKLEPSSQDKQEGGEEYKKTISGFQNFLFERWLDEEKPFMICEYSFEYDKSSKPDIFEESNGEAEKQEEQSEKIEIPEKANFAFPKFKDFDGNWTKFIKKVKDENGGKNGKLCNNSRVKLQTLSKFLELDDGYRLSALIHQNDLNSKNSEKKQEETQTEEATKTINKLENGSIQNSGEQNRKNPLYFFVSQNKNQNKGKKAEGAQNQGKKAEGAQDTNNRVWMWRVDKKLFKQTNGFKDKEWITHIVDLELKSQENRKKRQKEEKSNSDFGTITRTKNGVSFFYKKKEHRDAQEFFKKEEKKRQEPNSQKPNEKPLINLLEQLKNYFNTKPSRLLIRYLSEKSGNKLLKNSDSFAKNTIFLNSVKYLEELEKNQKYLKFISIFSKTSSEYKDYGFKKTKERQKEIYLPEKKAGLSLPLFFKKNLNNLYSDRLITLKNSYTNTDDVENQSNTDRNDGNIPELTKNIFGKLDKIKLHRHANELRKSIALWEYLKNAEKDTIQASLFFDDYVFDSVFHKMKNADSNKFLKTMKNIILMNNIKFDLFTNNIYSFAEELSEEIQGVDKSIFKLFLWQYIVEEYYGKKYFGEKDEERINYGGYAHKAYRNQEEDKTSCIEKTKNADTSKGILDALVKSGSEEPKKECEKVLDENKKNWNEKLRNYWIEKNYFLNDFGYDLSSEQTSNYLEFLHALSWSVKNNFKNIKNYFKNQIPIGKFGVFAWVNEIKDSRWKPSEGAQNQGKKAEGAQNQGKDERVIGKEKSESNSITLQDGEKYFSENPINDFIFNRFLSYTEELKPEMLEKTEFPASKIPSKAFAKTKDDEYTEFNGFKGFITEKFNNKAVDETLINAIFKNFKNSNPEKNKSFNKNDQNGKAIGLNFGNVFMDSKKEFLSRVNEVQTLKEMKSYLENLPEEVKSKYASDIHSSLSSSLILMKAKVIVAFNELSKMQDKPHFSRFSGYIQNPESHDDIYSQKYFIPKSKGSNEGYLVYITQLKKSDFDEDSNELFSEVSFRTFLKSVFLSAEMDEVQKIAMRDAIVNSEKFLI